MHCQVVEKLSNPLLPGKRRSTQVSLFLHREFIPDWRGRGLIQAMIEGGKRKGSGWLGD
jgi:hypothetical protein